MTNSSAASLMHAELDAIAQLPLRVTLCRSVPVVTGRDVRRLPSLRFVTVSRGKRRYRYADGEKVADREIAPGEILLVEPFAGTWCEENGDYDHFSVVCSLDMLRFVFKSRRPGDPEKNEPDACFHGGSAEYSSVELLIRAAAQLAENGRGEQAARLFPVLLEECVRALDFPISNAANVSRRRLEEVTEYIAAHLDAPLDCATLGRHCGISANYVAQLFQRYFGRSFSDYVTGQRMELAVRLLSGSGFNIGEIAALCGYRQPYYFIRVFRHKFGTTPLKWRTHQS